MRKRNSGKFCQIVVNCDLRQEKHSESNSPLTTASRNLALRGSCSLASLKIIPPVQERHIQSQHHNQIRLLRQLVIHHWSHSIGDSLCQSDNHLKMKSNLVVPVCAVWLSVLTFALAYTDLDDESP